MEMEIKMEMNYHFENDAAAEFLKIEKMLQHISWKWNKLTNVPFDELFSESKTAFMEIIRCGNWDKKKSKFSTYIYLITNRKLQKFCKNYHNISPNWEIPDFEKLLTDDAINETNCDYDENSDCNTITEMLKKIPSEYAEIINHILMENKKLTKQEITEILREKNWPYKHIKQFFHEIKNIVKNF